MEVSAVAGQAEQVSIAVAFGAGLVSFLSPCVLPIIPGYLSYITGLTMDQLGQGSGRYLRQILFSSLLFVLGFSIVFTALGVSASFVGGFLEAHLSLITRIAGVLVIFMGLFVLGVFKIPALYQERRFYISRESFGLGGTVVLGMAFGFGWTPCVGPILGAILLMAASAQTVAAGAVMLVAYSLGLGIPFVLTGLLFARAMAAFTWVKKHFVVINAVAGALLIGVGIVMLLDKMTYINSLLMNLFH